MIQLALFAAFPDATLAEIASYSNVKTQQARNYTRPLIEAGIVEAMRSRELHFRLTDSGREVLGLDRPIQSDANNSF